MVIGFFIGFIVGAIFCYLVLGDAVSVLEDRIRVLEREQAGEREEHFWLTGRIREYMDAVRGTSCD